jgi:hypothetical protein
MKICLIGSSRFMDKYFEVNRKLSLAGHTVYSIATRSSSADYRIREGHIAPTFDALTPAEKETLDLVHLMKIQSSEECFVITDESGYVGESTKREIKWAGMNGIDVHAGDHYLNHHLCGKAGLQTNVDDMLAHIRKAAAAGDQGDCREKVSNALGIYIGIPTGKPAPEAEAN